MDTNKLLDEIKEYFDVVTERPQDDIKLLAENISAERKTLKDHHKRLGKIEKRLDSVEGTIKANKSATVSVAARKSAMKRLSLRLLRG